MVTEFLDADDVDWGRPSSPHIDEDDDIEIVEERLHISGIPRIGAPDDKKRFSFGVSDLCSPQKKSSFKSPKKAPSKSFARRSVSQPAFAPVLGDDLQQAGTSRESSENNVVKGKRGGKVRAVGGTRSASSSPVKKRTKKEKAVLQEFFAVYCLISRNPKPQLKGRCYIGYTVDTNRRIMQHNGGKELGGAKKTDGRGPWDMIFCVEGFPNNTSGLRFEWASQNPKKSRVLKALKLDRRKKESVLAFRVRIACHLMSNDPWKRLGLTFRWLIPTERIPFPLEVPLPSQMKVVEGLLPSEEERRMTVHESLSLYSRIGECGICGEDILRGCEMIRCLRVSCNAHFHVRCMAERALKEKGELRTAVFPVYASCASCGNKSRWSDLIRAQHDTLTVLNAHPEKDTVEGWVPKKENDVFDRYTLGAPIST